MNSQSQTTPRGIIAKTAVVHSLTYFVVGLTAFCLFDYRSQFADPALSSFLRPTDHPLVQAGVLFQPLRGVLFGLIFYLLRDALFHRRNGWMTIWATLVVIGIVSTFGPAPGSIEGLIYTRLSTAGQWGGMVEVLSQSLLLSIGTYAWVNRPQRRWLNWTLGIMFVVVLLLPTLGLLAGLAAS